MRKYVSYTKLILWILAEDVPEYRFYYMEVRSA